MRSVADLNEAANLLHAGDEIVLALPVNAVLAQRLRLPTVDPSEFGEMVRLQVEKSFPFPPEEVTSDFEVIEQAENDSIISSVAVHNPRLTELAAPLINRGHIPRQVTVYAAQRAATRAARGRALIIYREGEKLVSAISENGKLSLTRTLDAEEESGLEHDLPQLALSAELQGIDTSFPTVLLDESCLPLRDTIERVFAQRPSLMGMETPPATVKLDLTPETWRKQSAALVSRSQQAAETVAPRFSAPSHCSLCHSLLSRREGIEIAIPQPALAGGLTSPRHHRRWWGGRGGRRRGWCRGG